MGSEEEGGGEEEEGEEEGEEENEEGLGETPTEAESIVMVVMHRSSEIYPEPCLIYAVGLN